MTQSTTDVTLRHGIAPPQTIRLSASEMERLTVLPVEVGLDFLIKRVDHPNGFVSSLRQTLRDPHCIIEIRQGDAVRVLTRKELARHYLKQDTAVQQPEIEIGISKPQAGG